jgi:hypothetical protein
MADRQFVMGITIYEVKFLQYLPEALCRRVTDVREVFTCLSPISRKYSSIPSAHTFPNGQ